jgi:hypothetical protein
LSRDGGSLELLQVRARLFRVMLRHAQLVERVGPLLIGPKKHDLANHNHGETQPEKPAFQVHGVSFFAFSQAPVKHEMSHRVRQKENVLPGGGKILRLKLFDFEPS